MGRGLRRRGAAAAGLPVRGAPGDGRPAPVRYCASTSSWNTSRSTQRTAFFDSSCSKR